MYGETETQKEKRITNIRAVLAGAKTLNEAEKKKLIGLNFTEFPRIITAHRGHRSNSKLESLIGALELFAIACTDLICILDEFDIFSATATAFSPDCKSQFDIITARLRKEIFTFSDLAHSIQDHCRRVQQIWSAGEFKAQLAHHFGTDQLHDFVIAFRTAIHHLHLFDPKWELRQDEAGKKTSHFNLKKEELINDHDDWGKGKRWLDAAPQKIDLRSLVTNYQARHVAFYDWYISWAKANLPAEVAEYRELRLEQRRSIARMQWNFLLGEFLKRGVNPMEHIHKYLTSHQIVQATKLPPNSRQIADFAITCVDTTGGCTPELREMVYKLFDVPGAT